LCTVGLHSFEQPLSRVQPHALHSAEFQAEDVGSFLISKSEKVFDLHKRAPLRVRSAELLQQAIYRNGLIDFDAIGSEKILNSVQRDELRVGPSARVIDQVPTHRSSRYSEEMLPVPPIAILGANQSHVDLINQLCCLQGMTLALTYHEVVRETP